MIIIGILIAFIVVLDQLTKSYAVTNLPIGVDVDCLDPIFHFHYHENKGAAWGIFAEHPWVFMALSSIAIVAIVFFLIYYRKKQLHPILRYGLAMIVGGGIGNMIDRVLNGYVVDFIEFGFFDFPIFNVADSFVTIGSFGIMFYLLFDYIKDITKKRSQSNVSKEKQNPIDETDNSSDGHD